MTEIETRLAEINARAAPVFAANARLITALNNGIALILSLAAVGIFFAVAEQQFKSQDLDRQELTHVASTR